jgi:uncharacterized protein (DUF58 family)
VSSVRLRKRAASLLGGAAVLFVIGTNVQAGWLFVLSALLLGAVIAGTVLPFAALRRLDVELLAPAEAVQGGETFVDLCLTNRGRGSRWAIVVVDLHLSPVELFVPAIGPGERVELTTLRVPQRRGDVRTESVTVRSSAPFGVAERRRRLTVDATTLVLPRVVPIGRVRFIDAVNTTEPAIHTSSRPGRGPEYLSVREYRPGDSLRHVHWPLTARHGQVMVREFEEEQTRRLAVVVDTDRDTAGVWTSLDRVCSVAASVLEAALAHGHGVRLIGARSPAEVDVLHRAGEEEMLRWLARLGASGCSIEAVLDGLGHTELRGVETALVVAPSWGDRDAERLSAASRRLDRFVERVVVVAVPVDPDDDGDAATWVASAEEVPR